MQGISGYKYVSVDRRGEDRPSYRAFNASTGPLSVFRRRFPLDDRFRADDITNQPGLSAAISYVEGVKAGLDAPVRTASNVVPLPPAIGRRPRGSARLRSSTAIDSVRQYMNPSPPKTPKTWEQVAQRRERDAEVRPGFFLTYLLRLTFGDSGVFGLARGVTTRDDLEKRLSQYRSYGWSIDEVLEIGVFDTRRDSFDHEADLHSRCRALGGIETESTEVYELPTAHTAVA